MRFHFDPNLQFQLDAINAVVRLFAGTPYVRPEDRILGEVVANRLDCSKEHILANRDAIMGENSIVTHRSYDDGSPYDDPTLSYNGGGGKPVDDLDFSIEMETGTGKTYVYLRTIFELHRQYGLTKFIIVVPSVAVREGVLKTLDITREHFCELFHATPYDAFPYDGKRLNAVKHFAYANALQIMIMNMQAFNTKDRIINQQRDQLNGDRLIELIRHTRPILILDEPQEGMDTPNMVERLASLHPLCKIRYSATHRVLRNLLYRLTPYDAYRQGLVKKIEVLAVAEQGMESSVRMACAAVQFSERAPTAKLSLTVRQASGEFKEKIITARQRDDLAEKTQNPAYRGWIIERIYKDLNDGIARVVFSNGTILEAGKRIGQNRDAVFTEQIRWAIRKHFEKKDARAPHGIKALTLFFIDRVANYTNEDGIIRVLFRRIYTEEYRARYHRDPQDTDAVHAGYFAKTTGGEWTDSEASMRKNSDAYDLILRDKERLLSIDEPVQFIFSHSALGVGWDNPNVFTICTLHETESVIKKRQEIGRGLRICVNADGNRVMDPPDIAEGKETNLLTVIANQSYSTFAASYQRELIEEYGPDVRQPQIRDARDGKRTIRVNREQFESEVFRALWERIAQKTACSVRFSFREEALVQACIAALAAIVVPKPEVRAELRRIITLDRVTDAAYAGESVADAAVPTVSINLVDTIVAATALSVPTVRRIVDAIPNPEQFARNPLVYATEAGKRIKRVMDGELVLAMQYTPTGDRYPLTNFEDAVETFARVVPVQRGIYDHVEYESDIEQGFAEVMDGDQRIRVFAKLPRWYEVPTPIGAYHPDWALVVERRALEGGAETRYYFVVETKGTDDPTQLRPDERMKIACATKHFKAIGLEEYVAPVKSFDSFTREAKTKHAELF